MTDNFGLENADDDFTRLQEDFRALGYQLSRLGNGSFFVTYVDQQSTWSRHFIDLDRLNRFHRELQHSTEWRLNLTDGDVTVDRETGLVTPHDDSEPFNVTHPAISGWSGTRPMGQGYRFADEIYVSTQPTERPTLGGAWHKVV